MVLLKGESSFRQCCQNSLMNVVCHPDDGAILSAALGLVPDPSSSGAHMIPAGAVMRFARPTNQLDQVGRMYIERLGFSLLFSFQDHEGFDGIIVGHPGHGYPYALPD
jgi:hypothetical protein